MKLSEKIAAIEFVDDEVKVAVVKTGGKSPAVLELHCAKARYAEEEDRFEALVLTVQDLLKRVKTSAAAVVLCVPSQWSIVRTITIPFKGRKRVAAAVRFELEPYLAFPVEDLAIDFLTIREKDGQTEVLAMGMRKSQIQEHLAVLDEAGVDVDGVGLDVLGLTDLWQAAANARSGFSVVLHAQVNGAALAILVGKNLVFFRHLNIGFARMHENPKLAAREVQNSLRAFRTQWGEELELDALSVTGVRFFDDERMLFEEAVGMHVTYDNLLSGLKGAGKALAKMSPEGYDEGAGQDGASSMDGEGNYWEGPVGVASAAAGGQFSRDFMKEELRTKSVWHGMTAHVVLSCCLAIFAAAALGVFCYMDYQNNVAEMEKYGHQIWEDFSASFPKAEAAVERHPIDPGGATSYDFMSTAISEMSDGGGMDHLKLFGRTTLLDILKEISTLMPEAKVRIGEIQIISGRRTRLAIFGEVVNSEEFNNILAQLRQTQLFTFDEQNFGHENKDGKETFKIYGNL